MDRATKQNWARISARVAAKTVARSVRSIGSCLLFDFSADKNSEPIKLTIENAQWRLLRIESDEAQLLAFEDSSPSKIDVEVQKLVGLRIISFIASEKLLHFKFDYGYELILIFRKTELAQGLENWYMTCGDETILVLSGSGECHTLG